MLIIDMKQEFNIFMQICKHKLKKSRLENSFATTNHYGD